MLREIKCTQRNVRKLHAKVDGTGTAAISSGAADFTLVDNGTGDYTLTPRKVGQRLLCVKVQAIADAGDLIATVKADSSASAVRILLWDGTDGTTAKDGVFFVEVTLSDAADETY